MGGGVESIFWTMHNALFLRNGGFFFLTEIKLYTNNTKMGRLVYFLCQKKKVQNCISNSLCARIRINSKTLILYINVDNSFILCVSLARCNCM